MAEILETILASKIYRVPFDSRNMSCFPSPNALKGKILLKSRGRLMKVFSQFESNIIFDIQVYWLEDKIINLIREPIQEESSINGDNQ